MKDIGIVDIHSHILPGVDDGAENWDETRWMLCCAYEQGIRAVIATPHYSRRQEVARLRELADQADQEAGKIAPDFHVYLGQEILYFDSMVEGLKEGHVLTMAGSRHVLIEFLPEAPYKKIYQAVRKVLLAGYYPVIAHVERYAALRDEGQMAELAGTGCLMQMNYRSLQRNGFDRNVRWCRSQVQDGRIDFLGTDAHHRDFRTPEIEKSLRWMKRHVDVEKLSQMTEKHAREMLGHRKMHEIPGAIAGN